MSKAEVIEKTPISLVELKADLKGIVKRDGELGFRAGKTQEYVNAVAILSKTAYDAGRKNLEALEVPRLKDIHIVKILDLLPTHVNELNVILQGYTLTVSKENMTKIVGVIKDIAPKKK